MPSVNFMRPELVKRRRDYALINDALAGEQTIKSKRELYLPAPQSTRDDEGKDRYDSYITRAVFLQCHGSHSAGLAWTVV